MGFFSWKAQDTGRSIPSHYSQRQTITVYMLDNKGNKWKEDDYEGYGVFGGKDYYELLAEMNGKSTREEGIDIEFNNLVGENYITQNLNEHDLFKWVNRRPECCEHQGFFYPDHDEDNDDYN
jgi:hypothetical protein